MNHLKITRYLTLVVALVVTLSGVAWAQSSLDPMTQIDRGAAEWLQSIEDGTAVVPRTKRATRSATVQKMTGPNYVCLPTCIENDGRFLSIAGDDLQTLSGDAVVLRLAVPASEAGFEIGFFDGDSSGTWDFASGSPVGTPLEYTLRADPDQDGGGPIVAQWSGATMLDNAWTTFTVNTGSAAATPSGNYFYLLTVNLTDTSVLNEWSNFKVRTTGAISTVVSVTPVAFSFATPLFGAREGFILYPNAAMGDFTTTTYDGSWSFFVDAFESLEELSFWDGDFDRGSVGNTELDTDDPDTPNAPFLPPWAVGTAARPEGVAFVLQCSSESSQTGCPADDRSQAIFLRSPSIRYEVSGPNGGLYANENPSGNREWEQFLISTTTSDPALVDHFASELPSGVYEVRAEGVDLSNLNAWRFFHAVLGVCDDGTPCGPTLRPYLVGDSVFFDLDGDGVQGADEAGISGVAIEVLDANGEVVATGTTDADGRYEIMVEAGTFTVRPADSSFEPGGALEGLIATNSPEQTGDVVDDNNLDFDFGFRGTGSIGDLVWVDTNADGAYDAGIDKGVGGVTLRLTEAGPDGILGTGDDVDSGSTVSATDGSYSFESLGSGTYRVDVDDSTVPADYVLVAGSDPADVTLGPGEMNDDVDFGYQGTGSIGDMVFFDRDRDGMFDAGTEQGIGGVTVTLTEAGPDGVFDTADDVDLGSTVTDSNGVYTFDHLVAGDYRVDVQDDTVPSNFVKLTGAGDPAFVTLGPAETNDTVGFGYFDPAFADGTDTIGYWKNHPGAWPVDSLTLGAEVYTQQEAIALLRAPVRGDASIQLGKQLIAAKLSVASGNYSFCIMDVIAEADALLTVTPVGTLSKKDKATKSAMNEVKNSLDAYNKGRLCAPHRG